MTCPYLKKVEAYYCEAFPQKVLIPCVSEGKDSCQSHEEFKSCSIYKEHEEKKSKNIEVSSSENT